MLEGDHSLRVRNVFCENKNSKYYLIIEAPIDDPHLVTTMGINFLKIVNYFVEHENCLKDAMVGEFGTEVIL